MFARSVCVGTALLLVAPVAPAAAPEPRLAALDALQPGLWSLRPQGAPPQDICVTDPYALIQLRHAEAACSRLVIADEAAAATIHYSCPGAGWGRTTLRLTTPRVVRIDTQGIADNAPFAFSAEARRTGPCPADMAPR